MGLIERLFGKSIESTVALPDREDGEADGYLSFEDLQAVELRIGTVLAAEPVQKSPKLLRLTVDFGEESPRRVLSGIAQSFPPEELISRQFAFVANLAPRSIMGEESQAMIVAADGESGLVLVTPTAPASPGSRLH